ncbi:unnamed protein product, partial [Mesorhabditis spiculigera]
MRLREIELIDVLWRSDLSGVSEKRQVLERQEESDLAALTHKSITQRLSAEETARYEELSKSYFEDFYAGAASTADCLSSLEQEKCYTDSSLPSCSNPVSPLPKELPTPTDVMTDVMPRPRDFSCELPCPPALVGASAIPSAAYNSSHFWHNHTEDPSRISPNRGVEQPDDGRPADVPQ